MRRPGGTVRSLAKRSDRVAEGDQVRHAVRLLLDAVRPRATRGIAARVELRQRSIQRLQGPRPRGASAASFPVDPAGPLIERVIVLRATQTPQHAWRERALHRLVERRIDDRTGLFLVEGAVLHQSGGVGGDKRPKAQKTLLLPYLHGLERRGDAAFERFDRPVHHLGHVPRGNYYHWLIEVLPTILLVVDHEPEAIVLTPTLPAFASSALDRIGVEHQVCTRPVLAAEALVVDTPEFGRPHPREIERVREAGIRALSGAGRSPQPGRVYVSRANDSRSLAGEERLERRLEELGFTIFHPGDRSDWLDQVAIFAGAETVIGPHGAGLSNVVFCPDGAEVIELQPDAYSADMFAAICAVRGLRHTAVRLPVGQGSARHGDADVALELLTPLLRT